MDNTKIKDISIEDLGHYMEGKTIGGVTIHNDALTGRDDLQTPVNKIIFTLKNNAGELSQITLWADIFEGKNQEEDLPAFLATYNDGIDEI